jgi:pimeloyl-ACP methyl ester carboxylesterase
MSRPPLVFASITRAAAAALAFAFGAWVTGATAQQAAHTELKWSACSDVQGAECAGLAVPVDPARPAGEHLTLRLARKSAIDPAQKKGVLLIIPGGPGVDIAQVFGQFGAQLHIDDFRRWYDVVTFDPRGVGQSNPVRCNPADVPTPTTPADRPPSPAEFRALGAANAALFRSCFALTGALMAHLSSMNTAADIERIRKALTPNEGLVAYSGSYGTSYAEAYLERYGEHVKALVLDAVVDHSVGMPTFATRNILSVRDAFDRFAQWCKEDSTCALHGRDVGKVFDAVAASTPVMRTLVPQFLAAGRDPQFGWPAIAQMLANVSAGNRSALENLTAAQSSGPPENPQVVAGLNGLTPGVLCADFGPQRDYESLIATGDEIARRSPRFAWKYWDAFPVAHASAGVGMCVGWPLAASNPPHRLRVGLHPNVMVANDAYDPPTPLINALSVWLQIPDARLLIADVDGHQSLVWSRCAFETQLRFLLDPASVQPVTLCPD